MDARLEISARLDEVIKTAILTRRSESTVAVGAPDDVVSKLGELSIAGAGQFPGLAARGRDLCGFSTLSGLADADPAVARTTKLAVRRAWTACKTLTSDSGAAPFSETNGFETTQQQTRTEGWQT